MTTQFELIYSQDEMLKSKENLINLSAYIYKDIVKIDKLLEDIEEKEKLGKDFDFQEDDIEMFEQAMQVMQATIKNIALKDKIVGDIMFGILDVYEDLVEDAFNVIQFFNKKDLIANKKLIILSFIEILKKDSSLKQKILEEINFLAFENSLEDWQFLKDAIKEINDKFPG
jgi:hypothetical protein